jgi:hypothetical protein
MLLVIGRFAVQVRASAPFIFGPDNVFRESLMLIFVHENTLDSSIYGADNVFRRIRRRSVSMKTALSYGRPVARR